MNDYPTIIYDGLNEQKDKFSELFNSGENWQTNWTKLLKTIIRNIGWNKGFCVSTGGIKAFSWNIWSVKSKK